MERFSIFTQKFIQSSLHQNCESEWMNGCSFFVVSSCCYTTSFLSYFSQLHMIYKSGLLCCWLIKTVWIR
jgi:hypothetical protein